MPKPAKFQKGRRKSDAEYNQELKNLNKKTLKKPLSDAVKKTLLKKADETKFTYTQLAAVFRRGQSAYLTNGSRNVSMTQWAMARVNSYIQGGKARKADADIYSKNKKPDTYKETYTSSMPKDLKEKILNIKQQEKSLLESGHLRPLLERYSMILPPEVREKLEEGTLIFNTSANELQIVDANNTTKVVGTIENPNSKEWVGGLVDKDGNREEIRAINSTFKPEDVQKNYKYIQGLSTTEKAFYFKYVSPIGYYSWHKVASNYIENYKNSSQEKRFKVFSSPAYYLTDELAKAFINTPVQDLKLDEEPKIVNNSFFVFQSTSLNNVRYVFVDCVYQKGFVYLHISFHKNYGAFSGQSIKFAWNDLNKYKKIDNNRRETDGVVENQFNIIVNMILLMNQQPDIEVEYMPPSITIPVQKGFSKPEVFKPRPITWVGKEFSKRIVKIYPNTDNLLPKQPGMPKRSHWRRGHWHTVLQGPKREQRRMKWYEPVFIKGKRLTSVDV
tara:strand:+ start:206 stop:1708 length:1503 start_codon:yes stop_codon:yes gene_type:complete